MKPTKGEKIFQFFNAIFLIVLSITFILPMISVLSTSFVSEQEFLRRGGSFILFPEKIDFTAYKLLLDRGSIILDAYKNTIFRVVVGTLLNVIFTATLAYGLSKKSLPGRNLFITFIFITMILSGGLIPTYMLIDGIGLKDSPWVMIIPSLISAWNFLIMKSFFSTIPAEIEESALIDGATPLQILIRIIFPLSLPSFATIGLFYAVYHWNEWFTASIYINDVHKLPIQVIMRNILLAGTIQDMSIHTTDQLPPAQTLKSAIIIVSTVPILFVYPFVQKYFVKGVMIGSVKE
ncbi:carbohydrate ABC transporter permease [Lederbergia graminis]|uniref:Carbohydrate ABC transporter permease n=1 Tax=Lederbergia graminis TaxID=735518 RepID=A0ABW0LP22_9BACI